MSGPDKDSKPDDALLEDFLAGTGKLTAAYRAIPAPSAPPTLDVTVLRIARDEAGRPVIVPARPRSMQRFRLLVAIAATLVLSFSFLTSVQRDDEARRMVFDMAPPAASPPARQESGAVAPDVEADRMEPESQVFSARDEHQPPSPPPPAVAAMSKQAERPALPATPAMPAAPATARRDAPLTTSPANEVVAEPEISRKEQRLRAAETLERRRPQQNAFAGAPAAERAPAMAANEAQAEPEIEEPLPWLNRIRALRDAEKTQEARNELVAFRRAWPEHPLPEDLRPLALSY